MRANVFLAALMMAGCIGSSTLAHTAPTIFRISFCPCRPIPKYRGHHRLIALVPVT